MGGAIAQEFALQYPAKTRSLILGCTAPGGSLAVRAESEVADLLMARGITLEQAREDILPYIYDATTPREKSRKISACDGGGSPLHEATWHNSTRF